MIESWTIFLLKEDQAPKLVEAFREVIAALPESAKRGTPRWMSDSPFNSWDLVVGGEHNHVPQQDPKADRVVAFAVLAAVTDGHNSVEHFEYYPDDVHDHVMASGLSDALGTDVWTYGVCDNTDSHQCTHYRNGQQVSCANDAKGAWPIKDLGDLLGFDSAWLEGWSNRGHGPASISGTHVSVIEAPFEAAPPCPEAAARQRAAVDRLRSGKADSEQAADKKPR